MKYTFFGTCFDDIEIQVDCLKSMANQTIPPNELVLVDASTSNSILKILNEIFNSQKTTIIYKKINYPRVKALNYAISKASSDYLIRFDSRTRFSKNYAEESIKLLNEKNKFRIVAAAVGARQKCIPANSSKTAKLASELMDRAYVYGNPRYRRQNYSGEVNSIYLGCFPRKILQETLYREDVNLISEDSQICKDLISKGYKIFMSENLNLNYLCRDKLYSVIRLFREYGRCRAKTIISTKTTHDNKKFVLLFIMSFVLPCLIFIFFKNNIFLALMLIILVPFSYNFFYEINNYGLRKVLYMPVIALIAQLNWILGFFETLILYNFIKNKRSNFFK